ncbi:MAG: ABC transporter substrate-binding protein [Bacillota bacterium]
MKKIFTLFMVLALLLTACGTNTGGTSAPAENAVELAQGVYEDKIVVGTTGAQQGPLAAIGKPYFDGMKAYFNTYNDNGGIDGKKIELMILEDEFKPENAIANVQKLINDEQVFTLVGLFGTPGVKASIPTVQEAGIPAVYFATGATAPTKAGDNFFPVQPNYWYEGKLMSKYIVDYFKATKVAVIYRSDDVGLDGLAGLKDGFKVQGKEALLVAELSVDAGSTDYTAQVAKVKESGADLLVMYGLTGEVSGTIKEMEKVGMTDIPIICPYPNVADSFIASNKEAAPNVIQNLHGMGWVDMTRPAVGDLEAAMNKYFPDSPMNAYTVSGWVAAETFVKGLEKVKEKFGMDQLTWENYIAAMEELEYTEGIIPKIAYALGERQGVMNMAVCKVEGDTWATMTDYLDFK